jgi:hypothetical protein
MRGNKMAYFWGLVKKEFIEIGYSRKSLLLMAIMFVLIFYIINESGIMTTNPNDELCLLVTFLAAFSIPMNFLMESILSDKSNQTLERYFVMGKIKVVMFAKFFTMTIIGIIPISVFYITFLLNGINIINNIYTLINMPLYFWIGSSIALIVIFIFNDEKSISFASMPCILLMVGLIKLNYYIGTNYNSLFTCIITVSLAVIMTFVGYKFYKNTKYFLKI